MPQRKVQLKEGKETIGQMLERHRKAADYSLWEHVPEIGISHKMPVYYEDHTERSPEPYPAGVGQGSGSYNRSALRGERDKGNN